MATLLNDSELRKLLGTAILDGDPSCIRSNSYVLRLGALGEFLSVSKEFDIGKKKKGIKIQPGQSVAVTAYETLDFRRETIHQIYPGCDLHALISPTTDLSREGIVAQATHVDAGFHGTLNWTLTNTSNEERRFVFQERIYRLTLLKLSEGEIPENLYAGDYQSKTGYVRSQRKGAPVGMKDSDWEDASVKGGPQELLENLIRSGYPWNILGERLKVIDDRFELITNEYAGILDSINEIRDNIGSISEGKEKLPETIRKVLTDQAGEMQNRWLIASFTALAGIVGFAFLISSSPAAMEFIKQNAAIIGIVLLLLPLVVYYFSSRPTKPTSGDTAE